MKNPWNIIFSYEYIYIYIWSNLPLQNVCIQTYIVHTYIYVIYMPLLFQVNRVYTSISKQENDIRHPVQLVVTVYICFIPFRHIYIQIHLAWNPTYNIKHHHELCHACFHLIIAFPFPFLIVSFWIMCWGTWTPISLCLLSYLNP
jgi:hypothetical protein